MKLGDTIFNGNAFKNIILNSKSYKRMILGTNLVWSYFGIAIKAFRTRILADSGTYEAESILEDRLQEITPDLFDSASLVITPNGVKTSKLYSVKPNDGTGDLDVIRATTATRVNESGVIVDVPANIARIDYSTGQPAILVEPQRTNLVYPSDIATTQIRAVTAQVYTLSFYGTGTVTLSGAFSGSLVGTGIKNRVSLTFTPTAGNLTLTVSGSVTNWQLEAGSNATSYIPTTTGSVTRNADVISNTNARTLIGQTEGSVYLEVPLVDLKSNGRNFITLFFNNSNWVRFRIQTESLSNVNIQTEWYVNNVFVNQGNANMPRSTSLNKILFTYKIGSQVNFFHNGVKLVTTNPIITEIPPFNQITLGAYFQGAQINEGIKIAAIWKTQLTDAQAIQLTTL